MWTCGCEHGHPRASSAIASRNGTETRERGLERAQVFRPGFVKHIWPWWPSPAQARAHLVVLVVTVTAQRWLARGAQVPPPTPSPSPALCAADPDLSGGKRGPRVRLCAAEGLHSALWGCMAPWNGAEAAVAQKRASRARHEGTIELTRGMRLARGMRAWGSMTV